MRRREGRVKVKDLLGPVLDLAAQRVAREVLDHAVELEVLGRGEVAPEHIVLGTHAHVQVDQLQLRADVACEGEQVSMGVRQEGVRAGRYGRE